MFAPTSLATDPNWLPSTLAQATAALVAIVGGFLVSRLITLASTRSGLEQRVSSLQARLRELTDECRRVHQETVDHGFRVVVDEELRRWVRLKGEFDIAEKLQDAELPMGFDLDELVPRSEALVATIRSAWVRIEESFGEWEEPPTDIHELEDRIGPIDPVERDIYRFGATKRREEVQDAKGYGTVLPTIPSLVRSKYRDRLDASATRESELAHDRRTLESELRVAQADVWIAGQVTGVWPGLVVLALFAALGIVYPMIVMGQRPVPDDAVTRTSMVTAFVAGFLTFLVYVGTYAWKVTKEQAWDEGMPWAATGVDDSRSAS